jgi:hypothetical protein
MSDKNCQCKKVKEFKRKVLEILRQKTSTYYDNGEYQDDYSTFDYIDTTAIELIEKL